MKRIFILLLALAAALLPLSALAQKGTPATVTVNGSATVSVPADYAKVNLGVETSAAAVADALKENAARIDAVLAALRGAGIAAEDIVTDRFYVYTQYDYAEGRTRSYQVSNALTVTVRDLAQIGSVIDLAMDAGANTCGGITFYSNAADQAADEALAAAIAEARRRAILAAEAGGMTLGRLVSLQEGGGAYNGVRLAKSADLGAGTQILAEGLDFTAQVSATFEMQ